MHVSVVKFYHIGPESLIDLIHMNVPVTCKKSAQEQQCCSNTPRQQAVTGVGKTMEQGYIGQYQSHSQKQIAHAVVYEPGESAESGDHGLEHGQVESDVIKKVIVEVVYVEQRHSYVGQQHDHRNGLVVEQQHECGRQTYYEYQRRHIEQQEIPYITQIVQLKAVFDEAHDQCYRGYDQVEYEEHLESGPHLAQKILGIAQRTGVEHLRRIELLVTFKVFRCKEHRHYGLSHVHDQHEYVGDDRPVHHLRPLELRENVYGSQYH